MTENLETKPDSTETLYKIGEVTELTGLSEDQIRDYVEEFNIQIERTKGGHRRFTKENVETLLTIKSKLTDQMWSFEQVKRWMNGESEPVLHEKEFQTTLEQKIDLLLEGRARDDEFQKILVQKLDEQARHYEKLMIEMQQKHQKELDEQRLFLENKLLERNDDIVNRIRLSQEEKEQQEESGSIFSKLFGKKKKHG